MVPFSNQMIQQEQGAEGREVQKLMGFNIENIS